MKHNFFTVLMLLFSISGFAQRSQDLSGSIINANTGEPVSGVIVILRSHNYTTTTDMEGEFRFGNVKPGEDVLSLSGAQVLAKEIPVKISATDLNRLDPIEIIVKEVSEDLGLVGVINEDMLADDDGGGLSQDVSTMVILSNDQYLNNVSYQLSPFRFKVRGYDNTYESKFINGVEFNDQYRGVFNYSSIGAINDATRNGTSESGFSPSTFTFGNLGVSENINMRSGNYGKGGKVTVSYTNRNYYLRGMASYATGLRDDGWAFNVLVGGRYSDRGNVDGLFYENISYAVGAEKQWDNGRHSLSFVTYGSPVKRGQQMASYQEVYDLVDDNLYNPNWGYQNGKRRNSRVVTAFDPTGIFSHVWKINENTTLTTGLAGHYSRYGGTALNWYNAPDPRPDYYRYIPSYFEDEGVRDYYEYLWKSDNRSFTQVNWDNLFMANKIAGMSGNESAVYMVEERRRDLWELSLNSTLNTVLGKNNYLTGGVGLRYTQSRQFKTVDDLLGAPYVLDIDKFAERDFPGDSFTIQNDLNKPNRKAYKDDVFGYDYRINIQSANAWIQNEYKYRNIDFYYGTKFTYTDFQRRGKMKNGRYPDNSYGNGKKHSFIDFALKAGLTYKINGRHFLMANLAYATHAPYADIAYISPRISDLAPKNLESRKIFNAELSYVFSAPSVTGRVSLYQTNFFDDMHRTSYYHDLEKTFVNHVLTGIDKIHRGFELGMNYRLNDNWNFDLAGTIGEYFYSNNPMGTLNSENGKIVDKEEKVYLKNYYVGATPQMAGTLGINYFYDYWFLGLNINGIARNYVEVSPIRRMASNYVGIAPIESTEYEAYKKLTHQERYGSAYTLDVSIGKIFYLNNNNQLNFNFSINNILNRRNIKTGGYEQGRMDTSFPDKFGSKYFYMQGINCYLNASYRF